MHMNENYIVLNFQHSYDNFVKIRTARQASPECNCPPGKGNHFTQCTVGLCLWVCKTLASKTVWLRVNGRMNEKLSDQVFSLFHCNRDARHFAWIVLIVWGGLVWMMQTADWILHLTERKVFNSRLYIEVLRGCLTCDVACLLEYKKKSHEIHISHQ